MVFQKQLESIASIITGILIFLIVHTCVDTRSLFRTPLFEYFCRRTLFHQVLPRLLFLRVSLGDLRTHHRRPLHGVVEGSIRATTVTDWIKT